MLDKQWNPDAETLLFGVIGDPIIQSKSPVMHNRAFRVRGLNASYFAFHVKPEQLAQAIQGMCAFNIRGLNVTAPHKVEVMKYLDEIDDSARVLGAVNTIVNQQGKLIGYNTDGIGYLRSLQEEAGIALAGKQVIMLGAGGAARGIAYAMLKEKPAKLWIANRTVAKAQELAGEFSDQVPCEGIGLAEVETLLSSEPIALVVNTTLLGMQPDVDSMPIPADKLPKQAVISDIIYNPLKTRWLVEAEQRGCTIHPGLGMFIYQGAYGFEYWTGLTAPVEAMREAVIEAL